jgi:hypothetical protein
MAICDKNGGNCYWVNSRRQPGNCSMCGWQPPDDCHPTRMLCATCFEEIADQEFVEDSKWNYPACRALNCRVKSKAQACLRHLSLGLPPLPGEATTLAPLWVLPLLSPPPGLPARSTIAGMYCTAFPDSAVATMAGNSSLAESVAGLHDAVLIMSRKADVILVLIGQLQHTISGNPRFGSLYH